MHSFALKTHGAVKDARRLMGLGNSVCFRLRCRAMIGTYHVFCSVERGWLCCAVLAVDGRQPNTLIHEMGVLVV